MESVRLREQVGSCARARWLEYELNGAPLRTRGGTSPGNTAHDYLKALANNQIKWLGQHVVQRPPTDIFKASDAQKSPDAHVALYNKYLAISPYIFPEDKSMSRSTLWHWDMHASNIFVEDDRITSLIDWQSTWAGPLFLQYCYPKLVDYSGEVMLKPPEDYKVMEESDKTRVKDQVERSIVQFLYEIETKKQNPLLVRVNDTPQGTTRRRTVEFAEDTWDGDILPFRQCLIRLERFVSPAFHLENPAHKRHLGIRMKWALMFLALSIFQRKIYRTICVMARDGTSRPTSGMD
ncbi:hypothetical protein VE03_07536 [Pseudogymnoascus sp. 23342-1-I1]|nr:hypothetical protein VE03_07536 [Pseudogymnoascus sp. 23342-1-I1]